MVAIGKSLEDYLEAIYRIAKEKGTVRSIDVARYLGFSKPSVSIAVKELKNRDLIETDENGYLQFTSNGLIEADKIFERHTFFKNMLIKCGVNDLLAEQDACKLEHDISDESFQKLKETYIKNHE
ncbi:metal-dependent transcriptional regulator [Mycoplasma sp. P36-A1]|uniref:metal-dependent transcriptional regulator n=1 Tax=Mycoplasma sp. P36-A1 TaxID=3252900 RepID=UPI003C2D2338